MILKSRTRCATVLLAFILFSSMWVLYVTQSRGQHNTLRRQATMKGFFVLSHLQSNDSTSQSPANTTAPEDTRVDNGTTVYVQLQPGLPTWKAGTFCDKFLGRTFRQPIPMCSPKVSPGDTVSCLKNPDSHLMVRCTIENLAVDPHKLLDRFWKCQKCELNNLSSAWLIDEGSCLAPTFSALDRTTEGGDFQKLLLHQILPAPRKPAVECQKWVDKTVFFMRSQPYHIYFRFLGYFNLHKAILEMVYDQEDFQIIRIDDRKDYAFPGYEKQLFPELITLKDLPDTTVCFRKVVFVPHCFSATPFRCKMESYTRGPCLECDGRKLYGTAFMSFRKRVITSCCLTDESPEERTQRKQKSLVFILRKPYQRWDGDSDAKFQRVLTNQDEVISALKHAFPLTTVTTVYMENIPACKQISMVHDADVLMGVHGAGLVHAWWLQEDALLFELVPTSQTGNPSFKTLTKLTGRRYIGFTISSGTHQVTADPKAVVRKLKEVSDLR